MANTRSWYEIYQSTDALTPDDRAEIDLTIELVGAILEARKGAGITQTELEALSGVNQTHIARIENNRTDPQVGTILKILRPLGKTLTVVDIPQHAPTGDIG